MNFPANLKYTQEHEWIKMDGDFALVGITDFAQNELGDIVFVEIESLGKTLKKNEIFGSVEAVKTVSDLFMPVSGEVVEVNKGIDANPEEVNSAPYDSWMIKIRLSNASEVTDLLSVGDYKKLIGHS